MVRILVGVTLVSRTEMEDSGKTLFVLRKKR